METHELCIGKTLVKNNIFLAPMAGYTDYAYRHLQLEQGAGLVFTELVSAKGLILGGKDNQVLLYSKGNEHNTAVQLFGENSFYLRQACESEYLAPFSIVDINMGCPVPKVFKNGEGSALLTDIKKAENIIRECVKSGKTITVKIRIGQVKGDDIATDYAMMAENAGASLITIHGRVREDYYSGEPNFNAIEKAKNSVKIPVIANGGIFTEEDAINMFNRTGADGVMVARGALANPFLIAKLTNTKTDKNLKEYILSHIELMKEIYSDRRVALEFRKFPTYYFKGKIGFKELKLKLQTAESTSQLVQLISENL